jgi:putative ABC transport system permease protein
LRIVNKHKEATMLRQITTVTSLSIKSLPQRFGSSVIIVVSIAGVVAVLIGVLTLANSLLRTIHGASQPDRAIVMSKGSWSEGGSNLQRSDVLTIEAAPGLAKDAEGKAIASPEVVAMVAVRQKSDNARGEAVVRGVTPMAFAARSEVKLVSGRAPSAGLHEIAVGRAIVTRYKNLEMGGSINIRGAQWLVVGVFDAGGSVRDSEIWTDAETLMSAFKRNTFQAVTVKLASPDSFPVFKDSLTTNPSLTVDVLTEAEYYGRQSEFLNRLLKTIAYIVGAIMAIGAMSGAVNCMYSAISARGVEIATLRALGFNPFSVIVSVLTEALLLAIIGAALGAFIAWLLLSGNTFSTQAGMGSIAAQLQVDGALIVVGTAWACAIGFLGGLFPAIKAARMPIATALREV